MLSLQRSRFILPSLARGARYFATVKQTQVGVVRPSMTEIQSLQLDARNLEKAVRHVQKDGLVVVEDVVPHEYLDRLNKKMVEDAHELQGRGEKGPFNYNKGNIQQDAPPVLDYFFPSVFVSKLLLSAADTHDPR